MRFFLYVIFCLNFLFADDSIDELLKVIQTKTDLSEKTKLQNGGVSFIWTRSDLDRMQVNKLKDILESIPYFEYKESSYGFPDLFTYGDNKAFISNNVRVFIDNQEIATGMYGSGFMLLGDLDLDFIDHIEVYLQSASYEYTTEATLILIKLYTKTAKKDNGGKIKVSYNNYNSKTTTLYYSNQLLNGWNYFTYVSYDENKRKKYQIENQIISRDSPTLHTLASIYNYNNRFLFEYISQQKDSFGDTSIDFTPLKANVNVDFLHLGYDGNYNNFYLLVDINHKLTHSYFLDDVIPLEKYDYLYPIASQISTIDAYLYNTELKYKYKTKNNTLITGIKYRYKYSVYTTLYRNDINLPRTGNTNQIVYSTFLENQYFFKPNSIINFGIMRAKVTNNASIQKDNILNYRIGNTFTSDNWTFKTIFAHTEFSIDPYLVNSTGFFIKDKKVKKLIESAIIENIIYKKENNKFDFLISYSKFKNYLIPDIFDKYLLYNSPENINNFDIYGSWTKEYNEIDKFILSLEYQKYNAPIIDVFKKLKSVIRNINSFGKYDIFNELVTIKTNDKQKYYFDYNMGIKYSYSSDFIISFKGENILNKSYKQSYMRANPETLEPESSLEISPIDRTFIVSLEYYF